MAIRWEGHGTHRSDYMGISATGRPMSYAGITFYELRGDRVARIWVSTNLLERLRELTEPVQISRSAR
jgi:predicted ester cyclase